MLQYYVFLAKAPAALIFSVTILLLPLFRPDTRIPRLPRLFLIIEILYVIGNTIELLLPTPQLTLTMAMINYIFIVTGPVLWFLFSGSYTGFVPFSAKTVAILLIIPIITVFVVFTNSYHQLFWSNISFIPVFQSMLQMQVLSYGPFFYITFTFDYLLFFAGCGFFVAHFITSVRSSSKTSFLMLLGVIIPTITNIIYIFKLIPGFTKDYSCLSLSIGGAFFALATIKPRLFREYPDARRDLIENVPYGFLILDTSGKILDASKTAGLILGRSIYSIINEYASDIFPGCTLRKGSDSFSIKYKTASASASLEFHTFGKQKSPLSGWLVLVKDCTKPAPPLLSEMIIMHHLVLYKSITKISHETGTPAEQIALEADSIFQKYTKHRYSSLTERLQLIFR